MSVPCEEWPPFVSADAYRLDMLATDIEDHPHNVTRFAVLAVSCDKPTGNDKTTLMVRVPNRSGALHTAVTSPLFEAGRNMTWIESFPVAERPSSDQEAVEIEVRLW